MAVDNTTTQTGNATREPELRYTPSGQAVASFGIAVNRRFQNRTTQEWEEKVSFFDVTAWAQLAENVAESVKKGDRITVTGRLDQRSWENDQNESRSKVEIVADDVSFSLKWATGSMIKNEKNPPPQQGGYQPPAQGHGQPAAQPPQQAPTQQGNYQQSGMAPPHQPPAAPPYDPMEAPF